MRYYYYGNPEEEAGSKDKPHGRPGYKKINDDTGKQTLLAAHSKTEVYGDLVIEEDTVYEIDRECLKCREKA